MLILTMARRCTKCSHSDVDMPSAMAFMSQAVRKCDFSTLHHSFNDIHELSVQVMLSAAGRYLELSIA
jgi:hypothetical protein